MSSTNSTSERRVASTFSVQYVADAQSTDDMVSRVGCLALKGRRVIETPGFLAITSRGVVPHLTPDVLAHYASFGGVHLALEDFVEKALTGGVAPIMKCPARNSTPLHTFTALDSSLVTFLAPRRTPAVPSPAGNSNISISIFTSVGFHDLTADSYSTYVRKLKPDMVVSLADIFYGTAPGSKRVEKMSDRTSEWLDTLLTDLRNDSDPSAIFAPILPVDFYSQSEYLEHLADECVDSISGLAIYSSHSLVDIPATTALAALPRLSLDEPPSPHEILRQVSLGMDIFTVPFIGSATDAGLALVFQFPAIKYDCDNQTSSQVRSLAIDLFSTTLASSAKPLLDGCICYTCTSHNSAFITHLLSAKEMLGWVLLQIHNHHILSEFFQGIRASISSGDFEKYRRSFESVYESGLPVGTADKPRARGYHYKSEGKDERRNAPAWERLGATAPIPHGVAGNFEDVTRT